MPETTNQILSQDELSREIIETKKEILDTLETLKKGTDYFIKIIEDTNNTFIALPLTDEEHLYPLVIKTAIIVSLGKKLDFLRDLKNQIENQKTL